MPKIPPAVHSSFCMGFWGQCFLTFPIKVVASYIESNDYKKTSQAIQKSSPVEHDDDWKVENWLEFSSSCCREMNPKTYPYKKKPLQTIWFKRKKCLIFIRNATHIKTNDLIVYPISTDSCIRSLDFSTCRQENYALKAFMWMQINFSHQDAISSLPILLWFDPPLETITIPSIHAILQINWYRTESENSKKNVFV